MQLGTFDVCPIKLGCVLAPEQMWENMQDNQIGLTACRNILTCFRPPFTPDERHALASWSDSLGLPWQLARFLLAAADSLIF